MNRTLRPVGEYLDSRTANVPLNESWPINDGQKRIYFRSGTAALAAACIATCRRARESGVIRPTILLPAYTCPDVVAAVVYAGALPELIDFETDTAFLDLGAVAERISSDTAAVIAVNFLGIPERLPLLRNILRDRNIPLIYDSCQSFKASGSPIAEADHIIHSFGRGKPVCLLGGGSMSYNTLTVRSDWLPTGLSIRSLPGWWHETIFNTAIRPSVYRWLEALPILAVGQTVYRPLLSIEQLTDNAARRLNAAISVYRSREARRLELVKAYDALVEPEMSLRLKTNTAATGDALRYPLLLTTPSRRDKVLALLREKGLGASPFYAKTLPDIHGMPDEKWASGCFPVAADFAARLLTLPVHSDVEQNDVEEIVSVTQRVTS